ncbi:MAG TPA: hypothetical protein VKR79_09845 [Gaiellaceae bacterium]|nr:hypothetical protein [Gaiellaceae bacterium]
MKTALATALAVASLIVAGCGSGAPKPGPFSFKAGTTATIANVATGATVRCIGIETAPVPPPGHEVAYSPDNPEASGTIDLLHMQNGSLVVSCNR